MTHVTDGAINWINVVNLLVCVIAAFALWMTVVLQQSSKQPISKAYQFGLLILAMTYAISAASFFGAMAGVAGTPIDRAMLSTAQICWMVRNAVVASLSIGGAITAWRLSRPPAENYYSVNHGYCVTRGKSAAQIPIVQATAER